MATDVEDYIADELRQARSLLGHEPTPREMYVAMLRLDPVQRAHKLNELDRRLQYAELGAEAAGRVHAFRRAMHNANKDARRVGR